MAPEKKQVFVAFSHSRGTSSGGWGSVMISMDDDINISSFDDLSEIAVVIKKANPSLMYSKVFVTLFRVMPSIAEDEEVTWMITYAHGNGIAFGIGMIVTNVTGPLNLDSVIELIKRQGMENPVVINLQPLE